MARLAIDTDFLRDFGRLPRPAQVKVAEVFGKFQEATHTGLHLEKIRNVRDDRLRSIRIDQFWRGIVLAPDVGDVYLLLTVQPHDDAYAWAQRRTVSVNAARGVIEIRDVQAIEERLPELQETASGAGVRLFDHLKDNQLRALGIDDQVLEFARALTHLDQLEAARGTLPEAQYDALLGLALGLSVEDVWAEVAGTGQPAATYDVAGALDRSADRIVLINGPDELMEVFSYPFDRWRIFLHPSQRRAAYGSFSGPARVTGGPGTGKTVAAMHRAKHLASTSTADRSILLTTFTRNLASSLEDALRLLSEDEDLLRRIEVRNLDQLANRLCRRRARPAEPARRARGTRVVGIAGGSASTRCKWVVPCRGVARGRARPGAHQQGRLSRSITQRAGTAPRLTPAGAGVGSARGIYSATQDFAAVDA